MPTRNLGKTGFRVGVFSLGGQAAIEKAENDAVAVPLIERALDLGVNDVDTSARYGGEARWSERYFGQVLPKRRSEVFVATKTHDRGRDGSLKLLETEGKAQLLSNPKVITKSGTQANFTVGGEIPVPYSNNQGIGAEFKKYGVILVVLPVVLTEKKDTVDVQIQLEVSNPNYSQTVSVSGTTIPSMITRQIQTEVELKSGETLVIGGLKSSSRDVSKNRVPILGSLPLIGSLFGSTDVVEKQSSLFLFVTFDIIK